MKKDWRMHIVVVKVLVVFIVLGLACASEPEYVKIPPENFKIVLNSKFVTETRISINYDIWGIRSLTLLDTAGKIEVSVKNFNEELLKERIEKDKVYTIYCSNYIDVDRIDGLMPVEEAKAKIAKEEAAKAKQAAEKAAKEEAQKVQQEQARKAEQERLANLYKQAGNNLGNLRNTSRRYTDTSLFLIATYNFGDGNYVFEQRTTSSNFLDQALLNDQTMGTYRVNGNTVIFLSAKGNYSYGTIVGTVLNIDGDIYR